MLSLFPSLSLIIWIFLALVITLLVFLGIGSADHYIRTHPDLTEAHLNDLSEQLLLLFSWRNNATLSAIKETSEQKTWGLLPSSPPILRAISVFFLGYRIFTDRNLLFETISSLFEIMKLHLLKDTNYLTIKTRTINLSSQVLLIVSAVELLVIILFCWSLVDDLNSGQTQTQQYDDILLTSLLPKHAEKNSSIETNSKTSVLNPINTQEGVIQTTSQTTSQTNIHNEKDTTRHHHIPLQSIHSTTTPTSLSSSSLSLSLSNSHNTVEGHIGQGQISHHGGHVHHIKEQLSSSLSLGLSSEPSKLNTASNDATIDAIRLQASRERRAALNERRRTILSTVLEGGQN
jgi:hypothetical protein